MLDKHKSNYIKIVFISCARRVMLKILQARLQQFVNQELLYIQSGFRKGRGTKDQIATCWTIEKAREFQKNICFIDYTKAFDCVDHNKLWKIPKDMGIPDHLTCLLRNLCVGQEATGGFRMAVVGWLTEKQRGRPLRSQTGRDSSPPRFSQPQEPSRSVFKVLFFKQASKSNTLSTWGREPSPPPKAGIS